MTNVECNSQCRYCYKKSFNDFESDVCEKLKFDLSAPAVMSYSVKELRAFLEKSGSVKDHVITFYGGEPLMSIQKIKEIMDSIDTRYMIQTNGLLLDRLEPEYVNRFDVILVSIDGDKEITDFNRGAGTYEKVISNIELIKKNGFKGEIIARMVIDEHSMLLKPVKHLIDAGFTSVHWQVDAGFYSFDFAKRDFAKFVNEYNKEVRQLLDFWISEMKKGRVLKLYPFLGIFESLYYGKKEKLRCGSGYANYTIATNGKISVCPIMHDVSNYQVGDIFVNAPNSLPQIDVSSPCSECADLEMCGGRCLYANKAKLWPKEGQDLICETVRFLINAVKERLPEIKEIIKQGNVKLSDFNYEKYSGPEIIP